MSFLESESVVIIDEIQIQRCPELLSYIQTILDSSKRKFIFTGEDQFDHKDTSIRSWKTIHD